MISTGQEPSIAAVFATYNKKECALRCLQDLLQQTRCPDRVIITVNGCSDGTAAAITEYTEDTTGNVDIISLPRNAGNPGGTWMAIERAIAGGCNWVWLLDDDARVEFDALERLTTFGDLNPRNVYGSLAVDPTTGEMSWPLGVLEKNGRMRIACKKSELPAEKCFQVRGIWLGALISREIFEQVGPLEADLFIRGEDEEYSARIRQNRHAFFCVKDSLVKHVAQHSVRIAVFGKNYFYQPALPLWKAYYVVRNHTYIRKKYAGSRLKGIAHAFGTVVLSIGCALVLDKKKLKRVSLYLKAGWDALTNKLGPRVTPPY